MGQCAQKEEDACQKRGGTDVHDGEERSLTCSGLIKAAEMEEKRKTNYTAQLYIIIDDRLQSLLKAS